MGDSSRDNMDRYAHFFAENQEELDGRPTEQPETKACCSNPKMVFGDDLKRECQNCGV